MKNYQEKENCCRFLFEDAQTRVGRFYHLFTPGDCQEVLFSCDADFRFGMNVIASAALDTPGVHIITFELMSNHIHIILAGTRAAIYAFFELLKRRLRRHYALSGRKASFHSFEATLKECEDLESLRNVITYCNRNNYVVDARETPFSYPYGSNGFFFNPWAKNSQMVRFGELTILQKREMLHSHRVDYPENLPVVNGYISPAGYCNIHLGESFFRDARHYFYKISRDMEAYSAVAAGIGDKIFYTDDELYAAASRLCVKSYGSARPSQVAWQEKMELARMLHLKYNASNKQLQRILRVDPGVLRDMFPEQGIL